MPPPTNTEQIRALQIAVAILSERIDALRAGDDPLREIDRTVRQLQTQVAIHQNSIAIVGELDQKIRDHQTQLTLQEHELQRLEKKSKDATDRRWEIGKLLMTAILSMIGTLFVQAAIPSCNRLPSPGSGTSPTSSAQTR